MSGVPYVSFGIAFTLSKFARIVLGAMGRIFGGDELSFMEASWDFWDRLSAA
jgi:hypothetical protein